MAQRKAFVDASHSLNELSHALALLESENSSLRGAVDGFTSENAKLRELVADAWGYINHPANDTWTHKKRKEVRDSIGDRMRELGVGDNA